MFKLPHTIPTSNSNINELTDYFEWRCIVDGSVSLNDGLKPIALINDEINNEGINSESDQLLAMLDDILNEFQRRSSFSNNRYPFEVQKHGYRLSIKKNHIAYWVYVYLLLCTRLNMKTSSIWNKIDGTLLFEELSAEVARNYFGERAESFVFGTSTLGGFQKKVSDLCLALGEGQGFSSHGSNSVTANDDKLDVVVWKSFSDKQFSKLIGFGQCKTGTSWDDGATIELQPADFCKKWFINSTIEDPVKMFFCSQYFPLSNYQKAINAGIVFDRFRILDFLPKLDKKFSSKIEIWCKLAIDGNSGQPTIRKIKSQKVLKKTSPKKVSKKNNTKKSIKKTAAKKFIKNPIQRKKR